MKRMIQRACITPFDWFARLYGLRFPVPVRFLAVFTEDSVFLFNQRPIARCGHFFALFIQGVDCFGFYIIFANVVLYV